MFLLMYIYIYIAIPIDACAIYTDIAVVGDKPESTTTGRQILQLDRGFFDSWHVQILCVPRPDTRAVIPCQCAAQALMYREERVPHYCARFHPVAPGLTHFWQRVPHDFLWARTIACSCHCALAGHCHCRRLSKKRQTMARSSTWLRNTFRTHTPLSRNSWTGTSGVDAAHSFQH